MSWGAFASVGVGYVACPYSAVVVVLVAVLVVTFRVAIVDVDGCRGHGVGGW